MAEIGNHSFRSIGITASPCCTDRPGWRREEGDVGERPVPRPPDACRAVPGRRRAPSPHPRAVLSDLAPLSGDDTRCWGHRWAKRQYAYCRGILARKLTEPCRQAARLLAARPGPFGPPPEEWR